MAIYGTHVYLILVAPETLCPDALWSSLRSAHCASVMREYEITIFDATAEIKSFPHFVPLSVRVETPGAAAFDLQPILCVRESCAVRGAAALWIRDAPG